MTRAAFRCARALLRRLRVEERGQVLMLGALLLVPMLGFGGIALDIGVLTKARWELQHAADAAALAAVQQLPGCESPALATAHEWANRGDHTPSSVEVMLEGPGCDTVRVVLRADVPLSFMRLFGIDSRGTYGSAAAQVGAIDSTRRFMPWGLTTGNSNCLDSSSPPRPLPGATCVLKVSDGSETNGDRGALDVNGGGGSGYRNHIVSGTAFTQFGIGQTVSPLPGNKIGPTGQGIRDRLLREPSSSGGMSCDSNGNGRDDFDEVFSQRDAASGPGYAVRYACRNSPRLMTVPIVDRIQPPDLSTILGWATVYLQDYACVDDASGACNGRGHWEVTGRIVDAVWTDPDGTLGSYKPGQPAAWFLIE